MDWLDSLGTLAGIATPFAQMQHQEKIAKMQKDVALATGQTQQIAYWTAAQAEEKKEIPSWVKIGLPIGVVVLVVILFLVFRK